MKNAILYFIAGAVPTNAEFAKAKQFMGTGPYLEFVSLENVDLNGPLRDNVGVAGDVPEAYSGFKRVDAPLFAEETKPVEKKAK